MAKKNKFPAGWDEARVKAVLQHYEEQTDDEAVAEDEAAFRARGQTVMVVPQRLVSAITKLITREKTMALRKRPNELRIVAALGTKRRKNRKVSGRGKIRG
jgi:hypothetical protein